MNIALLRGINLGGRNRISMKDLTRIFVDAGCDAVSTFIQSGNVIFAAPAKRMPKLPELIAAQIERQFGYRIPVVLRTDEELREAVRNNPFIQAGADENTLHVLFLAGSPNPALIGQLDPNRSPPDQFVVHGKEIYLRLPNGIADTKLTNNFFDSKLKNVSTGRNWRTVTKLVELTTR